MKVILTAAAVLVFAAPAAAQTPDARWNAWSGCWELRTENVREGAAASSDLVDGRAAQQTRADLPRVCVTPAANGGARFETSIRGQAAVEQTITPDGVDHAIDDKECRGTQRAEWSRDGLRLYSRAELMCPGDATPRQVTGFLLLARNGDWIDIQGVDAGERDTVRVRRYRRPAGETAAGRGTIAAATLTLDDLKDAASRLPARVVEAALVETGAGFNLTSKSLIDLDDAGVPDTVIDLLVALSYPDRFIVERRAGGGGTPFLSDPFIRDPYMLGWAFGHPVWYDAYFYSPYYYYSPFGYSRYGYGGYAGAGGGTSVAPVPLEPQPSGRGRVVDGQGYTRVRERPAIGADEGSGPVTRASSGGGDAGSAPVSGGGSTASSGGYSSGGGSGGDTGRTAVPR